MRAALLLLLALLLSACAVPALPGLPVATPTPKLLTREQAIEIAVKSASMSRPEVSPALVAPTNVQAERTTLGDALRRAGHGNDIRCARCAAWPAWYVTMDGLWQDQASAPDVTPTPGTYRHAIVILDAIGGSELSSTLKP
jgi:hypothetical protein